MRVDKNTSQAANVRTQSVRCSGLQKLHKKAFLLWQEGFFM